MHMRISQTQNNIFLDEVFQNSNITPETSLLDVGCGDGEIPIKIRSVKKCNITALDGSESMLREFKKKLSREKCRRYNSNSSKTGRELIQ